jgi:hypothetical protein
MADPNQTTQQAVDYLKEQADSGKIDSFLAIYTGNGNVGKIIAGNYTTDELFRLVGLLEVIKQEITISLMADSEEVE